MYDCKGVGRRETQRMDSLRRTGTPSISSKSGRASGDTYDEEDSNKEAEKAVRGLGKDQHQHQVPWFSG